MTRLALHRLPLLITGLLLFTVTGWARQADPLRGEALYAGKLGLSRGGAPCLACHGIASLELGPAAAASYGPDLTSLYADYGAEGVTAILEDPATFESMAAIYQGRPLSDDEIADLSAFFARAADQKPMVSGVGLTGHVMLATLVIFAVIGALGWRRLQGVRQALVERARFGKGEIA